MTPSETNAANNIASWEKSTTMDIWKGSDSKKKAVLEKGEKIVTSQEEKKEKATWKISKEAGNLYLMISGETWTIVIL